MAFDFLLFENPSISSYKLESIFTAFESNGLVCLGVQYRRKKRKKKEIFLMNKTRVRFGKLGLDGRRRNLIDFNDWNSNGLILNELSSMITKKPEINGLICNWRLICILSLPRIC